MLVFLPIRSRATPFFDYVVPPEMAATVRAGVLVAVPFREQMLPGVVVQMTESPSVPNPRPLFRLLDPEPALGAVQLALAEWMARETLAPLHECVKAMLPPGLRARTELRLTPLVAAAPAGLPEAALGVLRLLLDRGALLGGQVATALRGKDWRQGMVFLRRKKLIEVERTLELPEVHFRTVRQVSLGTAREGWEEGLKGVRLRDRYWAILEFLEQEPRPVDVSVVYAETGCDAGALQALAKRGLVSFTREVLPADPLSDLLFTPTAPPRLTDDQQVVWKELAALLPRPAFSEGPAGGDAIFSLRATAPVKPIPPVLLLGVTGSGKTELYLRATERVLGQGRQALILVPEISLTPQTVRRFALRFPGHVGLWHSGMTDAERYATWRRVRSGELTVLVGARSALFAPFPRLGLIVLDEEEDPGYKQSQRPFYHAREAAEVISRLTGALLILGSATPTLESYQRAQEGRYRLLELPRRVLGHRQRLADWQSLLHLPGNRYSPLPGSDACTIGMPPVQIVDMRAELQADNRSIFSRALAQAVDEALAKHEQVILFLNRRGTATYVFCRDCGWVAACPRCESPMTQHAGIEALICHHCGHRKSMPERCPKCRSKRVRAFGLGTEGLEVQTAARWPEARLQRWDRDVARSHTAHATILSRFAEGGADILIGTQMVARGLDLPRVTVVGIISADTGLNLPDFRSGERTFQLLAQVAGRAGRGVLGGKVILQTYHPTNYAIRYAAAHDYRGFAAKEMAFRRETGYPPMIRLARLVIAHPDARHAQTQAEALAGKLREALTAAGPAGGDLIGPAPAFFARVRGRYRWQILVRCPDPAALLRSVEIPAGWVVDVDPSDVL